MINQNNKTDELAAWNSDIVVIELNLTLEVLNNQSISENPISHCETASTNCTEESENGGYFYKVCG